MAAGIEKLDPRQGQVSRLLEYLPAIFQELPPGETDQSPLARFLMAFESILLGLPKTLQQEWSDLEYQPGFEEILGGALGQGTSEVLLDGIERYFDPGPSGHDYPTDPRKIADYNRAPSEFLSWLAGWVALTLRDDWEYEHSRKFIANAVQLYRLRGTKAGIVQFVQAYTGHLPVEIFDEPKPEFQLGLHSRIGIDTVIGGGAPFFFRVTLTTSTFDPTVIRKLEDIVNALIELQKPAHTDFKLYVKTLKLQIGVTSRIGVDTLLGT